jgi:tetratricopeptide (TPR) repeat protein
MTGSLPDATPKGGRRREVVALLLVLAAAASIRFAYLSWHRHEPDFTVPEVDAAYNEYWARAMATGDWTPPPDREDPQIRSVPYLRPPGYPFFLAAIYRTFGAGPLAPRVVQSAIGTASCLLAFVLARRRLGAAVALAFAASMATYWSFVYFEGEFLEPTLLVFLGLLLLALLDGWMTRLGPLQAAAAGIVLGLSALVRPTVLPFALAVVPWAWRYGRPVKPGRFRKACLLALFGAAAAATLAPAVIRNAAVAGEAVIVSPGGLALYMGNNPQADGLVASTLPGLGPYGNCFDTPRIRRALERRLGRRLGPGELSAYFREEALRFIRGNPGRVASLLMKKTALFFGPLEVGHNREDEVARASSPVLRLLPGNFALALTAFLAGIGIFAFGGLPGEEDPARRERQGGLLALAALYAACTFLAHVPFVVAGRYRVPMVPMLLLGGAYGAVAILRLARARRTAAVAAALGAGMLLFALLSRNPTGYAPDRAKWHFTRAVALSRLGDLRGARESYEEALRLKPGHPDALVNLGNLDLAAGDPRSAERRFREALAALPDDLVARYDLALALARSGKRNEAIAEYGRALAIDPEFADAHADLAELLKESGDVGLAAHHYGEAARIRKDAVAMLELSAWLKSMGMPEESARQYRRALETDPSLAGRMR